MSQEVDERRKKRRDVFVYAMGVVAVVLIWRGIWDLTAAVNFALD
jgi:hypothetical protein